jgi:hypothetical protein
VRDAQVIGHPLITLELGAVAAHAIVGEGTRTVLQGGFVSQVDIDLVQLRTAVFGSEGQAGSAASINATITFSSASHPFRNRFGLLEPCVERHQNEVGEVQEGAYLRHSVRPGVGASTPSTPRITKAMQNTSSQTLLIQPL